jgi:hypothetical protein
MLSVLMLRVLMLSVVMLSVLMLSVLMLSVLMLSVLMLSVITLSQRRNYSRKMLYNTGPSKKETLKCKQIFKSSLAFIYRQIIRVLSN